jgi:hypothetical protein
MLPDSGGGIVLPDSGRTDSGGGGTDSGGGGTDSGGGPRACAESLMPYPMEASGRCSAATRTCMNACMDTACLQGCIDADTTPAIMDGGGNSIDCGFCIGYVQFQCLDSMGCHAEVGDYFCCLEDHMCMTQACVTMNCSGETMGLNSCAMGATACIGLPTSGPYAICFGS